MKNFLRGLLLILTAIPLQANPIEATFVGVNGTEAFGYYVGPYYGRLEQWSVVLDCIDFANDVHFGQQWAANLSHINTQGDLANTRFGGRVNASGESSTRCVRYCAGCGFCDSAGTTTNTVSPTTDSTRPRCGDFTRRPASSGPPDWSARSPRDPHGAG